MRLEQIDHGDEIPERRRLVDPQAQPVLQTHVRQSLFQLSQAQWPLGREYLA